jgi:hypothetical protein
MSQSTSTSRYVLTTGIQDWHEPTNVWVCATDGVTVAALPWQCLCVITHHATRQ